jgi:fructose-bisphosphate aldolase class II
MSLKEALQEAVRTKTAIGHFNVSNLEGINAIVDVCREVYKPIIVGVSPGESDFIGIGVISDIVKHYRTKYGLPLFLNADHFQDPQLAIYATEAGFDSILFDASAPFGSAQGKPLGAGAVRPSFEENIKLTKEVVQLVKRINPNVLVEGELGYIGVGSVVRESVPEGAVVSESQMIKPEEAKRFVIDTGVDLIGPGVGNIHGIVKGYKENLSFKRIMEIRGATPAFLVLHGASGIDNESVRQAIQAGISVVHVNTELRLAWKSALQKSLADNPDEIAPYKVLKPTVEAIKTMLKEKIAVFNGR